MIEAFRHIFGLCGEPHMNIFQWLAISGSGFILFIKNMKLYKLYAKNTNTPKAD